jgi:hypothetical protein
VAWTLRRLVISAFVTAHLGAVTVWIVPPCVLKGRLLPYLAYYMLPLGQWQYWGMFAPNPVSDTVTLEAAVLDARGLLHTFAFPQESTLTPWQAFWHYRHSKYASNFSLTDEFIANREFGARHAVRALHLPAEAFPVDVQLYFQVRETPPPGGPPADPMAPPVTSPIQTYRFPTLQEVLP